MYIFTGFLKNVKCQKIWVYQVFFPHFKGYMSAYFSLVPVLTFNLQRFWFKSSALFLLHPVLSRGMLSASVTCSLICTLVKMAAGNGAFKALLGGRQAEHAHLLPAFQKKTSQMEPLPQILLAENFLNWQYVNPVQNGHKGVKILFQRSGAERNNRECRRSNVSMCRLRVRKVLTFTHAETHSYMMCNNTCT